MVRVMMVAVALALPVAAMAQAPRSIAGGGQVTGQQNNQASANQFQSQMQTDNSQQPPQSHILPPTASSQNQPNPMPQLAR